MPISTEATKPGTAFQLDRELPLEARRVSVNRRSATHLRLVLLILLLARSARGVDPAFVLRALALRTAGRPGDEPRFVGPRSHSWMRDRTFRRGWLTSGAAAIGQAGLTPHELRHTAASLAIPAGANVKALQRMLGHASAEVTLNVYSDLVDGDLNDVATRLDPVAARRSVSDLRPTPVPAGEGESPVTSSHLVTRLFQGVPPARFELAPLPPESDQRLAAFRLNKPLTRYCPIIRVALDHTENA
jgi:hypothetical protein